MKLNKSILTNLKYKIIVLLLAILVWFFVKTEDNYRYSINVPLRIANLGEERIILNDIPKQVETTFWGKGRTLFSLMLRRDVSYNMDVADINGVAKIILDKNNIRMLRKGNIDVLNIVSPKNIEIVISKLVTKKVPIISQCEIETFPGYTMVEKIMLNPDSVAIIGPKSEIELIASVFTEKKNYENIKKDLEKKVKLLKPDQKHITLANNQTKLSANIQKLMEKPIIEISVKVTNTPPNAKVTVIPSTLSLILEGGTDLLLNVTHNDVTAYIDYKKVVGSKEKKHPAYIETPPGTRYRDVKPMLFKIVVERKHTKR